jgi:two-component sensor histidine kinase
MLKRLREKESHCLLQASEAEQLAVVSPDPSAKADYERAADRWRKLVRSFEFQGVLDRFTALNKNRQSTPALVPDVPLKPAELRSSIEPADFLDRLAQVAAGIKPYSWNAARIGFACLAAATLIRFIVGWSPPDLRFSIYLPAILATGLVAGVPAAVAVGIASILIVVWAFIPPYFEFKTFSPIEQLNIISNVVPYLLTICFAHYCRVVLLRLRQRERANKLLTKELEHRSNNTFSVVEAIVQRSLAHDPQSRKVIIGRFRSVRHANELLLGKNCEPITIKTLLKQEFAAYGEDRVVTSGPEFKIDPEDARHAILLFHELATNAAKYGSLSHPRGRVFVNWEWNETVCALTWREVGGPTIVAPTSMGFGTELIRACIQALSGTIDKKFAPTGLDCSLVLTFRTNGT